MSNGTPPSPGFLDLSGINALNAQRDALKEQMLRARALGQPSGRQYGTWGGALAGGLGDVLGTIAGNVKEGQLAEALAANQKAAQGKRGEFNTALEGAANDPEAMERLAFQAIASGDQAFSKTGEAALELQGNKLKRAMEAQRLKEEGENKRNDNERLWFLAQGKAVQDKYIREHPDKAFLLGAGNQWFQVPRRAPEGAAPVAEPIQTEGGTPVTKPNELSTDDKKSLQDAAEAVAGINELADTFKPEFVGGGALAGAIAEKTDALGGGGGVMGKIVGAGSQALGGPGEESIKERKAWHQKYDLYINLPQRSKVFGASLSAGERASWAAAQDIARGTDPVAAQRALEWMRAKANEKLGGLSESSVIEGANPAAVQALTRRAGSQPPTSPPPLPTSTPVREPPRARTAPAPAHPSVGPHGPTVKQDGVTYRWNPKTGEYE